MSLMERNNYVSNISSLNCSSYITHVFFICMFFNFPSFIVVILFHFYFSYSILHYSVLGASVHVVQQALRKFNEYLID